MNRCIETLGGLLHVLGASAALNWNVRWPAPTRDLGQLPNSQAGECEKGLPPARAWQPMQSRLF